MGAAQKEPARFNRSNASPKNERDGKVKAFHEWSLSEFINVAQDIGLLKPDVQKFSHGLRDFRNYIHPYQQMISGLMISAKKSVFKFTWRVNLIRIINRIMGRNRIQSCSVIYHDQHSASDVLNGLQNLAGGYRGDMTVFTSGHTNVDSLVKSMCRSN